MEPHIPISELREKLLSIVDDLPPEGVLITRHERPIAKLTPLPSAKTDLIGLSPGIIVDPEDDLFSTGERWDAES